MCDDMKSIDVIIPHYPINPQVDVLLKKCIKSLVGQTNVFVIVNQGTGFGKAVNEGLRLSVSDYIAIVNNDVFMECGSLQDLAIPGCIMSPARGFKGGTAIGVDFQPSFFVIPRVIYETVGGFDEQFNLGDYEDDDFYERCLKEGFKFNYDPNVRVNGHYGFTKDKMENFRATSEENKAKFIKKWGRVPSIHTETFYEH